MPTETNTELIPGLHHQKTGITVKRNRLDEIEEVDEDEIIEAK